MEKSISSSLELVSGPPFPTLSPRIRFRSSSLFYSHPGVVSGDYPYPPLPSRTCFGISWNAKTRPNPVRPWVQPDLLPYSVNLSAIFLKKLRKHYPPNPPLSVFKPFQADYSSGLKGNNFVIFFFIEKPAG